VPVLLVGLERVIFEVGNLDPRQAEICIVSCPMEEERVCYMWLDIRYRWVLKNKP
jgi:hypothetical protein